jgi:hypothetical protein
MKAVISTDEFGRFSLPEGFWKALDLKCPAQFAAETVGDRIELTPVPSDGSGSELREEKGLLVISTGGKPFDAVEAVRTMREERS